VAHKQPLLKVYVSLRSSVYSSTNLNNYTHLNLPGLFGFGLQVQSVLQPATVNPQFLQNCLQLTFASAPGAQFTPHENKHFNLLHLLTLYFVAPGTQGQQALVPDETVMSTDPPAVRGQVLVAPTAPITVRGVATNEPRITGGT